MIKKIPQHALSASAAENEAFFLRKYGHIKKKMCPPRPRRTRLLIPIETAINPSILSPIKPIESGKRLVRTVRAAPLRARCPLDITPNRAPEKCQTVKMATEEKGICFSPILLVYSLHLFHSRENTTDFNLLHIYLPFSILQIFAVRLSDGMIRLRWECSRECTSICRGNLAGRR